LSANQNSVQNFFATFSCSRPCTRFRSRCVHGGCVGWGHQRRAKLNRNILIASGGQTRTRFVFELASPDPKLVKLTIKGYKPPARTITLPDLPNP